MIHTRRGPAQFATPFALLVLAGCASVSPTVPTSPTVSTAAAVSASTVSAEQQFDALIARQDRVYQVIAPLITKNAVLCKTAARPLLGFTAKNAYSFSTELRGIAERRLGLSEALQVMQVLDGSGALRAGVRRGDVLEAIQGQPLPRGAQAETEAARLVAPMMRTTTEIDISVLRDGKPLTMKVPLTPACGFTVDIGNAPQVNAYGDGRRILVTTGLLDALSDRDLAVILAREMAHSVQQHARAMKMRATLTGVIDMLLMPRPDPALFVGSAGLRPLEEKMDKDADRIAQYMLARAGLDPAAAITTLDQMAQRYPATVINGYTALHPWTGERADLMRSTAAEIRQKQAAKKPLVP
jgi:predicted Zn-dependent protease